jgi:hypothetical protein
MFFGKLDVRRHLMVGCCAIAGDATTAAVLAAAKRAKLRRETVMAVLPVRRCVAFLPDMDFLDR